MQLSTIFSLDLTLVRRDALKNETMPSAGKWYRDHQNNYVHFEKKHAD